MPRRPRERGNGVDEAVDTCHVRTMVDRKIFCDRTGEAGAT